MEVTRVFSHGRKVSFGTQYSDSQKGQWDSYFGSIINVKQCRDGHEIWQGQVKVEIYRGYGYIEKRVYRKYGASNGQWGAGVSSSSYAAQILL